MFKPFCLSALILGFSFSLSARAPSNPMTPKEIKLGSVEDSKSGRKVPPTVKAVKGSFAPFTGKVNAEKVRIRLQPDLDGYIVRELNRNEYISVIGHEGDFYCIQPADSLKAYIFRSFVLDGIVEGNRVNVRLEPDLEAPVIGHVNSGDRIDGTISSINRKWLEISPPASTRFYVSKEYIDYAGGPELKAKMAKRKETVKQLLEAAQLYSDQELAHEFEEIDFERVKEGFLTIIHEYTDFPKKAMLAKDALTKVQEQYLQKRIAYLEEKAALVTSPNRHSKSKKVSAVPHVKMWGTIEEGLFTTWTRTNDNKPMEDFYEEQRIVATAVSGILEPFKSPVKNKPGDYIIKRKNLPIAYIYSTKVDLDDYVGKQVTVKGSPRSNNNFAFPAYFVHEVEE